MSAVPFLLHISQRFIQALSMETMARAVANRSRIAHSRAGRALLKKAKINNCLY